MSDAQPLGVAQALHVEGVTWGAGPVSDLLHRRWNDLRNQMGFVQAVHDAAFLREQDMARMQQTNLDLNYEVATLRESVERHGINPDRR